MPTAPQGILIIASGAKVAIAQAALQAARRRGLALHATDRSADTPTRLFADRYATLGRDDEAAWIDALVAYCAEHRIGLALPTRHDDLLPLALARERFEAVGTVLALSGTPALQTCIDKLETARFFGKTGIPSPRTALVGETIDAPFPWIAKPRRGSAGRGLISIDNQADLNRVPEDYLIQERLSGQEYTVNVYVARDGRCVCAVPHARRIVENGESVQAITRRIPHLMDSAARAAQALPDAWGPLNLQAFYDGKTAQARFFEINPRLGGGFPLAHQAKAEFIEWLCQETFDGAELRPFDRWTENLLMMKYRASTFEIQ